MHVAMVIDEERLTHEHAMLRRLCIALIDHGMRLTRIVPPPESIASEAAAESEQRIALAPRVFAPPRVLPWWRRARAQRIAEALATAAAARKGVPEESAPDVIYAIGRGSWTIALDLAETIERPLAINVWSAKLLKVVPRPHPPGTKSWRLSGPRGTQHIAGYVAASKPIADALAKRIDPAMIALVPMGAPIPKKPRAILERHPDSISVAVIGGCTDIRAYAAMLGGLSHLSRDYPGLQIAMELRGPKCHEVWRIAKRADLLGFTSAIDDAAQHRGLLTQCDLLILPERSGELTSLMLEAMAVGMPVVARDDPFLDVVIDGQTGLIVGGDDPEQWAAQIGRLLGDPDLARRMGTEGRERVRRTHSSVEQSERLAATLEWIGRGGSYAFRAAE